MRPSEHQRGTAGAYRGSEHASEERVYRPLLFQSTGYASSELFRDSYEMHSRLPTAPLLGVETSAAEPEENQKKRHVFEPQIRLETLSSRAATAVLWVTYLVFLLAMALPYLQSKGYLETAVELPGGVCQTEKKVGEEPCIQVDKTRSIAQWTAYVTNVSRYSGSIEIKLDVREQVNASTSVASLVESNTYQELERVGTAWKMDRKANRGNSNLENEASSISEVAEGEVDQEAGYVLTYDARLYGIDHEVTPATKDLVTDERNQSIWIECRSSEPCEVVQLLEITQDVDRLGGSGYDAYFVIVSFRGLYPNVFGKDVVYQFAYTKPAIHVGEVIVRGVMVLASILALPCWFISVLNFHGGSWSQVLTVQKWLLGIGVVLVLWQNPVYAVSQLYTTVSMRTRFVSITSQSLAEASFYVFWLSLMDLHSDTAMTMLRLPKLFFGAEGASSAHDFQHLEIYVLLGFIRTGLILIWLVWIMKVGARSGQHLKALPYMATRFKQLSYRFLVLETLLIFFYIFVLSALQIFYLTQTWYFVGYDAFIQDSMHTFAKMHTGHPSLGKFVFLSVYVYLVMFVHLPPLAGNSTGLLASTAFHVDEKPRVDSYGFLTPDSNLFCVETAGWLLELAYQAYFDPPGCPSSSGYGELTLERYGFELITHLRSNLTDTHVVVAWSQEDHRRLVISFRGTTSKENWKSNLRADQHVLWITSRGLRWRKTCIEKVKDTAAKIPLLNMALPRVHRGFWIAYESIREELKEVTRLILDENPGVSVYITGHSMGGALAIIAAYDLAVNFSIKVNMYNFGGPRVGNPSFRQHYDSCVPTSYRVVMDGDIVPGWPKFWGLYQHVGTEISLDVAGNLIVDPSFVERHLHHSSRRKTTMHGTNVYRVSIAKCLENLTTS
ncbi:hypothetical protein PRIC1_007317 [Phytophthora ramorum]|uniref:Phospholipase A1-Igamma2, chloroplastic n=1 Tax=Phytophthora ramorum TaxID=164328 RepID=UPI0030B75599|nr:Phospholipase A1-Igamma2, chloroplastic [Phytophthora ramorum]KAH7502154.1 Phospholipase A1-Igamma2, chloroplastic [Phytophthora ramorum]